MATITSGSMASGFRETRIVCPPNKRLALRHWLVELMDELNATPQELIEELNIVCRIRQARQEAEGQERKLY